MIEEINCEMSLSIKPSCKKFIVQVLLAKYNCIVMRSFQVKKSFGFSRRARLVRCPVADLKTGATRLSA